jgi:alpha-L-fucosidase
MKTHLLFLLILLAYQSPAQTYDANTTWNSLRNRPYPDWFQDAKLGIFIHWGVYSVPAYSGPESYAEWFLRGLQANDSLRIQFMHHHYGENFTYEDFAPLWKAELFDAHAWAELFEKAGAKYMILVAKHHDGYCLWPSTFAPQWNSQYFQGRDFVGELAEAVRERHIRFGLYYSLAEWNNPLHRWYTDPNEAIQPYVEQHMIPQFKELVGTYKPDLLFADGEWFNSAEEWHARELISWYYQLVGDDAIVNDRWGHGSDIGFITPEYSSGGIETDWPWAEVRGLGRSFALNRNEKLDSYMTGRELIHLFVRTVSHGGGLIINVGPAADGQIPLLQQERLIKLGQWIKLNEEAIYGAKAWTKSGEEKEVVLQRIDPQINFNWVRNSPAYPIAEDHFQANWNGYLRPAHSGNYRFSAEADDGMRLYINEKMVLDFWDNTIASTDSQAMRETQDEQAYGKLWLEKDSTYAIRLEYFETRQNASISLFWESSTRQKEIIPQSALFSHPDLDKGDGLQATYTSMRQNLAYTKNHGNLYAVAFEWPGQMLALPIPAPKSGTKIHLLGYEKPLEWTYENDRLLIDLSSITYNDMPGHDAWTFRIENYE